MNRDLVYLQDILTSALAAQEYLQGLSRQTFLGLREKQDAVIRALEVVGEAARRLSQEGKDAIPDVPWRSLTGMRNILIHQYDNVDLDLVYDTVKEYLPPLIQRLRSFLESGLHP
jgi:uncharacterized protein with HEPN domain